MEKPAKGKRHSKLCMSLWNFLLFSSVGTCLPPGKTPPSSPGSTQISPLTTLILDLMGTGEYGVREAIAEAQMELARQK